MIQEAHVCGVCAEMWMEPSLLFYFLFHARLVSVLNWSLFGFYVCLPPFRIFFFSVSPCRNSSAATVVVDTQWPLLLCYHQYLHWIIIGLSFPLFGTAASFCNVNMNQVGGKEYKSSFCRRSKAFFFFFFADAKWRLKHFGSWCASSSSSLHLGVFTCAPSPTITHQLSRKTNNAAVPRLCLLLIYSAGNDGPELTATNLNSHIILHD